MKLELPIHGALPITDVELAARLGIPMFGIHRLAMLLRIAPIGGRVVFDKADAERMVELLTQGKPGDE